MLAATLGVALLGTGIQAGAAILSSPADACDPTKMSCAPGGGGDKPPICLILPDDPRCKPPDGGGGGVCLPPPGGSPSCGGSGPASLGGGGSGGVMVGGGNPINLLSGNKFQEETDLAALPGVLGLELKRYYNSISSYPGLAGAQWHTSYETVLYDMGSQVQIVQADGRRITLARGTGARGHLCSSPQPQDGQVRIEQSGPEAKDRVYHWRWADGRTLSFRSAGPGESKGYPLHTITAATGERTQLSYSPLGDLLSVTDPQGRKLSFSYGKAAAGHRALLQAVTTPVGRITYRHDDLGRLTEVAQFEAGSSSPHLTRLYHYEAEHSAGHTYALTGISLRVADAQGKLSTQRLSTYAYDDSGRAILSTKGRPLQLGKDGKPVPGTGIEQITLQYLQMPSPNEGRPDKTGEVQPRPQGLGKVLLTNSLGQTSELKTAAIGGQLRLIEFTGAGCSTCGPSNRRYGYDAEGRLLRTVALSVTGVPLRAELQRYDDRGRLVQVSQQAYRLGSPAGGPRLISRYEYTDVRFQDGSLALGQLPTLIAQTSVIPGKERSTRFEYNELGQATRETQSGWSPIDSKGLAQATPIERTTTYRYAAFAGKSVLIEIDGPLPNGPKGSPEDSDVTRMEWDAQGLRPIALVQPGGRRNAMVYEPVAGRVAEIRNEAGLVTQFTYDHVGQLVSLRTQGAGWPKALVQSIQYDALDRPVEWGRGEVGTSSYRGEQRVAYDIANRLVMRANVTGDIEQHTYDSEDHRIRSTRQAGSLTQTTEQEVDAQGRVILLRADQGRSLQVRYDDAGRPSLLIDSLGNMHQAGQRAPASGATPARLQRLHDDWGREVQTRSPDAGVNTRWFDAADRLVVAQDALGHRGRYAYDTAGRIAEQRIQAQPSEQELVTRWHYEGRRLVELEHPTQSERYEHDARGLVIAQEVKRPALRVVNRFEYDDEGRLLAQSLPDGSWLRYVRNGQGQVTSLERERLHTPWLRWMLPAQILASEIERDGVSLGRLRTGNGLTQDWLRSRDGALARLVLRDTRVDSRITQAESKLRYERLMNMLGVATAQAAAATGTAGSQSGAFPGALGLAQEPAARRDHRYLWDAKGNLLLDADPASRSTRSYAYDTSDRLVIEAGLHESQKPLSNRWLFDAAGRRLLQQQGQTDTAELQAGTQRPIYEANTHRWLAAPAAVIAANATADAATYDAQGQPRALGQRRFEWDALGRLSALQQGSNTATARYTYSHRGERIAKQLPSGLTQYLYQERRLTAELTAAGRVQRQYVYVANQPLAIIDTPAGKAPAMAAPSVSTDLGYLWEAWFGSDERIVWLHGDHLGAVEIATDRDGRTVWQGQYSAHGELLSAQGQFTLNLRLPGQYFDAESGLHYNDHRYYDPQRGEYLSPDPLGVPDGPNAYSYVRGNPVRSIDPAGLLLFAFDGTGNTDDADTLAAQHMTISNVVKLRDAYDDGDKRYITGVGELHTDAVWGNISPPALDAGANWSGPQRIDRMMVYLLEEMEAATDDEKPVDIDIVGFSRGAAQARDFANQIARMSTGGLLKYDRTVTDASGGEHHFKGCQKVNFRFMGLFDSVLSTNKSGHSYQLGIPPEFKYVAQAAALNEYRGDASFKQWGETRINLPGHEHWGAFPLESIGGNAKTATQTRVEMGFIGAHSDIGGGYAANELSVVALNWMIGQAQIAGVKFNPSRFEKLPEADPVIHDQSAVILVGNPTGIDHITVPGTVFGTNTYALEDRAVHGAASGTTQRTMGFGAALPGGDRSMVNADTHAFIHYADRPTGATLDPAALPAWIRDGNRTGTVDIAGYVSWLRGHGYAFAGEGP